MGRFTKIPESTFNDLQVDAGVLVKKFDLETQEVKDEDIICATTGGINVTCTPSFTDYGEDVDNCPANMLELKRIDSYECTIGFTSLGTSLELLKMALGAALIDTENRKVTPNPTLVKADFIDLWWVGDKADGGLVAVHLLNALSTGGLSLQTTKAGKGQISVTMTGHVSIEAQDVVPIEFYSTLPPIGKLTVTSSEGSSLGQTKITVTPPKSDNENVYKYKLSEQKETVKYGDDMTAWTDWDGSEEIDAAESTHITVAECKKDKTAISVGDATVNAAE